MADRVLKVVNNQVRVSVAGGPLVAALAAQAARPFAERAEAAQELSETARDLADTAKVGAQAAAAQALLSEDIARLAAAAAGTDIYDSEAALPSGPIPADGTWGRVQTGSGMLAYQVAAGAWSLVGWITRPQFETSQQMLSSTYASLGGVGSTIEVAGVGYRVVSPTAPGRFIETAGGVRLDRVVREPGGFAPLKAPLYEPLVSSVAIIASRLRDGFVYGVASGVLQRSSDGGKTWTAMMSVGPVTLLVPAGDGEVLAACTGTGVRRSSGWSSNPMTATWSTVLSSADSDFLSWGLDTDRMGLCVATHYRATDYTKSKCVWKSTDAGASWSVIFDLDAYHAADPQPTQHHLHGCAIDPWADNRIWIIWHANVTAGGTGGKGIMYSDDEGGTWTLLSTAWQPTTVVATPHGMVFGTDDGPGGILHVERTANAADMQVYLAAPFPVEQTRFAWVFAVYSEYDESEGVAYISFISQVNGTPAAVFASDGRQASELLRVPPQNNGDGFREFAFSGDQIVWRARLKDSAGTPTDYTMRTTKARRGQGNPSEFDTGRIMGGRILDDPALTPFRSTAVGVLAEAGPSTDALAFGYKARAGYNVGSPQAMAFGSQALAPDAGSMAFGYLSIANLGSVVIGAQGLGTSGDVAIGRQVTALGGAVAVGFQAVARADSVAIGRNAKNALSASVDYVAIGRDASADSFGTAIGKGSSATVRGLAIGRGSTASGANGIAIGDQAVASHTNSVVFGTGAASTNPNQFRTGANRHIHISERTAVPDTPEAGSAAVYLFNNAGVWELRARFSNGTQKTLASWI